MTSPGAPITRPPHEDQNVRAFALELTKGCNLRCGYCYYAEREDAYDPATTMSQRTAEQSVDRLLEDSDQEATPHLHLFGGEPLLNFPLVRHVVRYAEARAAAAGRTMTFEITTNGTRFTDEIIPFLNEHGIHVGVSFDGPPQVQDAARPSSAGSSHAVAAPGIRQFLQSRRGTPLMAKTHCSAVITRLELDLVAIVEHLEDLGFERIILSPATVTGGNPQGLRPEDLPKLLASYTRLAEREEARLMRGEPTTVTWFSSLLSRVASGERRTFFCEGGREYLGVAADGSVSLCYRFYENEDFAMGDVQTGIDRGVTERLMALPLDERPACGSCWARFFCGGGCHHENLISTGGLGDPNPVTCEILRHSMDLTLGAWARLTRGGKLGPRRPVPSSNGSHPVTDKAPNPPTDDRPTRRPGCHLKDVGDEQVVYEPTSHEVVILNRTAAIIFGLCDGAHTREDILDDLGRRFAAPRDVLSRDLETTLDLFRHKGLIA